MARVPELVTFPSEPLLRNREGHLRLQGLPRGFRMCPEDLGGYRGQWVMSS